MEILITNAKKLSSLIATTFLLLSCSNEMAEIRAITDINNKPVQTSYNAEYIFTERGKLNYKLKATRIDQYQGENEFIEASGGFQVVFFDSLESEEAWLSAANGRYTEKFKELRAWDQVVLLNRQGEKLETSELIFDQDSSRIYTEKPVRITTANGSVLNGRGLESNDSFTRYKIIQPTGDLYINEQDSLNGESK